MDSRMNEMQNSQTASGEIHKRGGRGRLTARAHYALECLEDRLAPVTQFAGNILDPTDYQLTNDADLSMSITPGDTVTFMPGTAFEQLGLIFGSQAWGTIQEAVDAAGANDEVRIAPDNYSENVTIATSGLFLHGLPNAGQDVIITPSLIAPGVHIQADSVTVDSIQVVGGSDHGILVDPTSSVTMNQIVVASTSASGIFIGGVNNVSLSNILVNNTLSDGIFIDGATMVNIAMVTVDSNLSFGLILDTVGTATVDNLIASGNGQAGISASGSGVEVLSVTNTSLANNGVSMFGAPGDLSGAFITNFSTVSLTNVAASSNQGYGFDLENILTLNASDLTPLGNLGSGGLFNPLFNIGTLNFKPTTGNVDDVVFLNFDSLIHTRAGMMLDPYDADTVLTANGFGDGGNDTFIIDFSVGNPIPPGGINLDGGTGLDSMTLSNGAVTTLLHAFLSPLSGSVSADIGSFITYTNLEPIQDNLTATIRQFSFGTGDDIVTLVAGPSPGYHTISSVSSSETVTFLSPLAQIEIFGNAGNDQITVSSIDSGFTGFINLDGEDGNDTLIGGPGSDILDGGPGDDHLEGRGGNDIYVFDESWGADTIVEVDSNNTLAFSGVSSGVTFEINSGLDEPIDRADRLSFDIEFFSQIIGSAGDDFFVLAGDLNLDMSIDGYTGVNTLDYSLFTGGDVLVDATAMTATGWGSFHNFQQVIGSGSGTTTVTGSGITVTASGTEVPLSVNQSAETSLAQPTSLSAMNASLASLADDREEVHRELGGSAPAGAETAADSDSEAAIGLEEELVDALLAEDEAADV